MSATTTDTKNGTLAAPQLSESAAIELARQKVELAKTKSPGTDAWELLNRQATALASSSMVPEAYRGNVPNCIVAVQMALRIGADPFAVMQNLDVIHGNPSWRAKFLIATVNASGRFSPLRYRWEGAPGTDAYGCRAVAKDKDGEECVGPLVSWAMVKAEGWSTKSGSKWKTMPELMFCYRAASFWTRLYCPELSIGINTTEESEDTWGPPSITAPSQPSASNVRELQAAITSQAVPHDPVTGEFVETTPVQPARDPGDDGEELR